MADPNYGARVWAVLDTTGTTVRAFGLGVHVGRHPLPGTEHGPDPETVARLAAILRRNDEEDMIVKFARRMIERDVEQGMIDRAEADRQITYAEARAAENIARPNPKIVLDDGRGVVWGAECWWGTADETTPEQWARGREIVLVDAPHPATVEDEQQRREAMEVDCG